MVKTKIIETTEKYDKDGKLVEKITREENTEDYTDYTDNGNVLFNKEGFLHDEIKRTMRDEIKRATRIMPQGMSFWH